MRPNDEIVWRHLGSHRSYSCIKICVATSPPWFRGPGRREALLWFTRPVPGRCVTNAAPRSSGAQQTLHEATGMLRWWRHGPPGRQEWKKEVQATWKRSPGSGRIPGPRCLPARERVEFRMAFSADNTPEGCVCLSRDRNSGKEWGGEGVHASPMLLSCSLLGNQPSPALPQSCQTAKLLRARSLTPLSSDLHMPVSVPAPPASGEIGLVRLPEALS